MSCRGICASFFFFSSRRRHTRCALVTGVQTCALPILIGVAIVVGWVLVAIFAALLAPFDPNATILPFQKPGAIDPTTGKTFWFGTDKIGRDILSRIIYGGQRVLIYGPIATACASAVGIDRKSVE